MSFKINDKVLFLPDAKAYAERFYFMKPLSNDKIYTVRGFDGHGAPGLYLEGIYNDITMGAEDSYSIKNFRKIDESFAENVLEHALEEAKDLSFFNLLKEKIDNDK